MSACQPCCQYTNRFVPEVPRETEIPESIIGRIRVALNYNSWSTFNYKTCFAKNDPSRISRIQNQQKMLDRSLADDNLCQI